MTTQTRTRLTAALQHAKVCTHGCSKNGPSQFCKTGIALAYRVQNASVNDLRVALKDREERN